MVRKDDSGEGTGDSVPKNESELKGSSLGPWRALYRSLLLGWVWGNTEGGLGGWEV